MSPSLRSGHFERRSIRSSSTLRRSKKARLRWRYRPSPWAPPRARRNPRSVTTTKKLGSPAKAEEAALPPSEERQAEEQFSGLAQAAAEAESETSSSEAAPLDAPTQSSTPAETSHAATGEPHAGQAASGKTQAENEFSFER